MKYTYNPRVLQCMRFKHEDNTGPIPRIVMDYEFDFCVGCDRKLWIENECYKIEKGCFIIRKPGQKVYSRGRYDCYMLTLDFANRPTSSFYSRNTATQMQEQFEPETWDSLPSVFMPAHYGDHIRIFEDILSMSEMDINENTTTILLVNQLLHLLFSDAYSNIYAMDNRSNSLCLESSIRKRLNWTFDVRMDVVDRVENGYVHTVEDNSGDSCRQKSYAVGHYEILGYGTPAY